MSLIVSSPIITFLIFNNWRLILILHYIGSIRRWIANFKMECIVCCIRIISMRVLSRIIVFEIPIDTTWSSSEYFFNSAIIIESHNIPAWIIIDLLLWLKKSRTEVWSKPCLIRLALVIEFWDYIATIKIVSNICSVRI